MKIEDHVRIKERANEERKSGRNLKKPVFVMVTYERPGMLTSTVDSFVETTPGAELHVFDDGSSSLSKKMELDWMENSGVKVHRLVHGGVGHCWKNAMEFARDSGADCAVMMEDDIRFSVSWLDVLTRMFVVAGENVGFVSCFRSQGDDGKVELLDGIEAFRVNFCTSQTNMVSSEFLGKLDIVDAARKADENKTGVDYHLFPQSVKMGRTNWMSVRSYVSHYGGNKSIARGHGYNNYPFMGMNRVYELVHGKLGWEPIPENMI